MFPEFLFCTPFLIVGMVILYFIFKRFFGWVKTKNISNEIIFPDVSASEIEKIKKEQQNLSNIKNVIDKINYNNYNYIDPRIVLGADLAVDLVQRINKLENDVKEIKDEIIKNEVVEDISNPLDQKELKYRFSEGCYYYKNKKILAKFIKFDGSDYYFTKNTNDGEQVKQEDLKYNHSNLISYKGKIFTGISIDRDVQYCYLNGLLCKIILPNGSQYYYKNGKLHREDGPAVVHPDGTQLYYINDEKLTKEEFEDQQNFEVKQEDLKYESSLYHYNDKPFTGKSIDSNGTQYYYKNGLRHREDGPAVIYRNGRQYYYKNDKLHREDGPAIIYPDGRQYYYKNGWKSTKY